MASEPKRQNRIKNSSEINEELKKISEKILIIEQSVSQTQTQKKVPKKFILCQIIGTLLVLGSWAVQNTIINNISSQTNNYYKVRTEMFVLEGKLSQEQLAVNLLNTSSSDDTFSKSFDTRNAYLDYVTTLTTQMLAALSLVNIGDELPSKLGGGMMTSSLKKEIESGCLATLDTVNQYRSNLQVYTNSLPSLFYSSTLTYQNQKSDLMIIAQQNNIKRESTRNQYNRLFLVLYSLGTMLIITSLFKEFKKIKLSFLNWRKDKE